MSQKTNCTGLDSKYFAEKHAENSNCSTRPYGIITGNVLEKMLTAEQRIQVGEVFHDSMLFRLDQERGFVYQGSETPAYGWISRLNTLGLFHLSLPKIWNSWWNLETAGRAICLLQYCSGLMYLDEENPLFEAWTCERGGGGPYLWEHSGYTLDQGWHADNVQFMREFITTQRVINAVRNAAKKLEAEPEAKAASLMASELISRREIIESRVSWLPDLLAAKDPKGWTF